ncbi:uncharacterized protein LOC127873341 isoform X1 [Dreissena polymorpha]|uniref:uncharacterized protein LOC127873341 isoform X1 n=1 Tax=Dreissena polymorpha TaxID=45954 RepID=UPI002264DBEE|nr:uncharacterized protein LOC127873341 isoform X1 [Dreissena polymorpha]
MQFMIFFVCIVLGNSFAQELYGASVNWRPTSTDSMVLSYRLIWKGRDTIATLKERMCKIFSRPTCEDSVNEKFQKGVLSVQDNRIRPTIFSGYSWLCIMGCRIANQIVANLSQLYFTDASSFLETEWESGVGTAELTFDGHNKDNIILGFADQSGSLVDGLGETHLSMAVRNDTKRANISPLVNVLPVYRVPLGCNITIRLFPFDGDGDRVTCHWQKYPEENSTTSSAFLNSHTCELIFSAKRSHFKEGDAINVSLYAEDYSSLLVEFTGASRYITSGPFCRTPIKLRVFVGNSTASCQSDGPQFHPEGTMKPYFKQSYEMDFFEKGYFVQLPFMTNNQNDTILTSGPRYMIYSTERNITLVNIGEWDHINDTTMKGIHQACGMAYSDDGTPGESRCGVLMLFEPDECKASTNLCGKGGICNNFFEHFTCTYPDFNVTENMSQSGTCNTGVTTEKGNDGLKIGLPVGLFLLLLLLLIAVTLYLKNKWSEKMRTNHVGDETQISAVAKKVFQ